jgi:hypothetical protein
MRAWCGIVVVFRPLDRERRMPLLPGFVLTGFFIWLAENLGTFWGLWRYPNQPGAWLVANLKHAKARIHVPEPQAKILEGKNGRGQDGRAVYMAAIWARVGMLASATATGNAHSTSMTPIRTRRARCFCWVKRERRMPGSEFMEVLSCVMNSQS